LATAPKRQILLGESRATSFCRYSRTQVESAMRVNCLPHWKRLGSNTGHFNAWTKKYPWERNSSMLFSFKISRRFFWRVSSESFQKFFAFPAFPEALGSRFGGFHDTNRQEGLSICIGIPIVSRGQSISKIPLSPHFVQASASRWRISHDSLMRSSSIRKVFFCHEYKIYSVDKCSSFPYMQELSEANDSYWPPGFCWKGSSLPKIGVCTLALGRSVPRNGWSTWHLGQSRRDRRPKHHICIAIP